MQRETGMGVVRNLVIKREEEEAGCTLSWRRDIVFIQCGGVRHPFDVVSTMLHELAHHMMNRSSHYCGNDHCEVWVRCIKILTTIFRKAVTDSSFPWMDLIRKEYGAHWATKLVRSETTCAPSPSPRRCFKCQKFGHNSKVCRAREVVCQTCATPGHSKDTCPNSDNPKCLNCKGSHSTSSRDCPRFAAEKAALQIQAESNCSLVDARKEVEQTSATTNTEPDHASTSEQHISYARTVAINQADLINRNLTLSEENARLREVINKLRQDNASLQQRLDGFGKRLSNLEKSRVDDAHQGTSRDGAQTIAPTPVGSTHKPSTADHNSALPPDTTDGVHNTTSVGSAHKANPVGDTHCHPVSKVNRASQTEMQRASNARTVVGGLLA